MSTLLTPPEQDDAVRSTRAEAPARASAWVAVAAVVLAVVLAPPSGDGFASGEFGRVSAGVVELQRGGTWSVLPVGAVVPDGATLRTTEEEAELEVRDGTLSLSRWVEVDVGGDAVDLSRGEVLLEAERTYAVRFGALVGSGRGTWRVSAGGVARFAVYDGGAAVRQPDVEEDLALPSLREAPVFEGAVGAVQPLRYLPSDPWDARLLAEAIRIDRLLAATERGLTARYGTAPQTRDFYGDFTRFEGLLEHVPALAVTSEDGRYGPPAETLVAMMVAELLVAEVPLAPDDAAGRIDTLRSAGAAWGLIVREHGLTAADLDRTVERAVRQRGEAVAEGTAAPVIGPPAPGPTDDPGTTPPPPSPTDPDPDPPPPSPPPDPDPPEEEPDTLDPVTDPVTDTTDDVGSLLDEVVPGASDTTDAVNDAIEGGADLVEDTVDDLLP